MGRNEVLGMAVVAALGLGWSAPAMGALMAYEGFDYPRGESLNGKAGGSQ